MSTTPVTPQSLEEAHRKESEEDEAASSTVAAIHMQLRGLNTIADSLQADIAAHNAALQQHDAAAPADTVKRMKHRAATLRTSYGALVDTAARAHQRRVSSSIPHSEARMSPQLAVLERVWVDMCTYSQPTTEAFTQVIRGYGQESRRRRIRDMVERWLEDKDKYVAASERKGQAAESSDSESPVAVDDDETAEVREAKERKQLYAVNARRQREAAVGLPAHVSLYPAVRLDTYAFNVALSSYLASLPLGQLTSQSSELSFPLSLLPRFKHDNHTVSTLMHAHGMMGEMAQVLRLVEEYKRMRREALLARGGARELQAVRLQHKTNLQYIYATLLRAFDTVKDVESAETVWAEIKEKASRGQVEVNRVMYHSMLAVYATANQQEKLRSISVEMSRAGLPMDEHSVCTVINQLCNSGHVADAIMLHTRLSHGSMGPGARQHRKTYTCLLRQLAQRAEVPFLTIAEVYRQGVECGMLWSARSTRRSGMAADALDGTWVADLRGVALEVIPVALHFHLSEMLTAYMAAVRQGRKTSPRQLLVLLRGQDWQLAQQPQQGEDADALAAGQANEAPNGHRNGHRLSVGAIDWDEREQADEANGSIEGQDDDATDGDESVSSIKPRTGSSQVLIDPFATAEEQGRLSRLDALKIQGSYMQRWVQHLLKQEWPSLDASSSSSKVDQSADSKSIDPSSPVLDPTSPSPPAPAQQLRVGRNQLSFWLAWHAHVAAGDDGAELFPTPRTNGQSTKFVSTIAQRIREKRQRLEAAQQHWERIKRGAAAVESSGARSLVDELADYKKREREELQVKARIFNTKRLPTAATKWTLNKRPFAVSKLRRAEQHESTRVTLEPSTAGAVRRAGGRTAAQKQHRSTAEMRSARTARTEHLSAAVSRQNGEKGRSPQWRRKTEASEHTESDAQRGPAGSAKRADKRVRRAVPDTLSSETLSTLLNANSGFSSATKQTLQAMQQRQEQSRVQRQAAHANV